QPVDGFDGVREVPGAGRVREVFEPRRRVDHVGPRPLGRSDHTRSRSRRTAVSMPRRNPRMRLSGRTGMNSMRFSYASARTCWPGSRPRRSRISRGMTTWNLGEMVTVSTGTPIDEAIVQRLLNLSTIRHTGKKP